MAAAARASKSARARRRSSNRWAAVACPTSPPPRPEPFRLSILTRAISGTGEDQKRVSDSVQGAAVEGWMFLSDYVVEAANHDAAHRHDEAVNSLARGVKAGDVESMTRLGKRLIAGDDAPYLPRDG